MLAEEHELKIVSVSIEPLPPSRDQILEFQSALLPIQCPMPEAIHHFAAGMYAREFPMPAGMVVVGKTHLHEHLMMVVKGHAVVVDEFGRYEVKAGFIQVSKPGAKRVVCAFEDTTFVTVHLNPTNTQDLLQIESEHIEPESEEMQKLIQQFKLSGGVQ